MCFGLFILCRVNDDGVLKVQTDLESHTSPTCVMGNAFLGSHLELLESTPS